MPKRTRAGFAALAMALTVLAGCAANEKLTAAAAPGKPPETSAAKPAGPSTEKLKDGREGFIITEAPAMDEASRKDFHRAVGLLEQKDYAAAIDLLEKVIERSPGVTAPYIDAAIAYERIGKAETAEKHLKTALALFPGHPVASNEYGLLCRRAGRFAEAREVYEKAAARFPEYYPLHRNLGILCDLYLNDTACALERYEIYSKARPQDGKVKAWIADLRGRAGRN
jgi:Tfp pilus assembly protein PilF